MFCANATRRFIIYRDFEDFSEIIFCAKYFKFKNIYLNHFLGNSILTKSLLSTTLQMLFRLAMFDLALQLSSVLSSTIGISFSPF